MPLSYGGGIHELSQIEKLLELGIEKVVINTALLTDPPFLSSAVSKFGSSTIVASVDIKMNFFKQYQLFCHAGYDIKDLQLIPFLRHIEESGAGELMVNSVDNDGTMNGYDIELAKMISSVLTIPVVFCGGAGDLFNIKELLTHTEVSAAAAGSLFVFHGPYKGVLITYPSPEEIGAIYN
jgi:cyclase